jgi:hypothetical protein
MRVTCPVHLIFLAMTNLKYLVKPAFTSNYEARHYVIFSRLLLLPLSEVHRSISNLFSNTLNLCGKLILTVAIMKSAILFDVTPYGLVYIYRHFG